MEWDLYRNMPRVCSGPGLSHFDVAGPVLSIETYYIHPAIHEHGLFMYIFID